MLSWNALTHLSDNDLARHDIAAVNLACAEGLPGADRLDLAACQRTLDGWADQVGKESDRVRAHFDRRPEDYSHSWAYFRVLVLATVLQRDIGIRYDPALIERDDFFADSRNLFIMTSEAYLGYGLYIGYDGAGKVRWATHHTPSELYIGPRRREENEVQRKLGRNLQHRVSRITGTAKENEWD